jgi:hypothetical protein
VRLQPEALLSDDGFGQERLCVHRHFLEERRVFQLLLETEHPSPCTPNKRVISERPDQHMPVLAVTRFSGLYVRSEDEARHLRRRRDQTEPAQLLDVAPGLALLLIADPDPRPFDLGNDL